MDKRILYNAIQTPDGTILHSKHVHDYVCHVDKNGKRYCVDGGNEYLRRSYDVDDYREISVYDDQTHETRRSNLRWGVNYDVNMNRLPKTIWTLIKNLTSAHIEAILNGGYVDSNKFYKEVFENELEYRKGKFNTI